MAAQGLSTWIGAAAETMSGGGVGWMWVFGPLDKSSIGGNWWMASNQIATVGNCLYLQLAPGTESAAYFARLTAAYCYDQYPYVLQYEGCSICDWCCMY